MYFNEDSFIYNDGKFEHPNQVSGDMYSQSLHYGNGVFEGIRAYKTNQGTKIFKPIEHYNRLLNGAQLMQIPCNFTAEELTDITYELLAENNLEDAYIRPLIVTGANMSLKTSDHSKLIISVSEQNS